MDSNEHAQDGFAPTAESAAYRALSRLATADRSLEQTLVEVTALAKRALPETPEASVTLLHAGRPRTAACSAEVARRLDERQYDDRDGPCLDAALSGRIVQVAMAEGDGPYPLFRRSGRQEGVTHALSVGLGAVGRSVGALNLYSLVGSFAVDSTRIAGTFAGVVGLVLAAVGRPDDAAVAAERLQQALASRAVINQAQGVLMGRLRCTRDQALTQLIRLSEEQGVRLQEAARTVLDQPG